MKLKMNKIWKTLVVVLVITTSACGQQRGGQGGPPQGGGQQQGPPPAPTAKQIKAMVSDLSKELLLTDEQETQVLALYTEHFEAVEEKTSAGRPDRDEMDKLKTSFENDVKELLTEDQIALYTTYLKNNSSKKSGQRKDN